MLPNFTLFYGKENINKERKTFNFNEPKLDQMHIETYSNSNLLLGNSWINNVYHFIIFSPGPPIFNPLVSHHHNLIFQYNTRLNYVKCVQNQVK